MASTHECPIHVFIRPVVGLHEYNVGLVRVIIVIIVFFFFFLPLPPRRRVDTYGAGPSHSTPEDPNGSRKFSSRIKDMITTRFSKSNRNNDQAPETNLNNSADTPAAQLPPTPARPDDPALSPHSQLIQHGVYLAVSNQMQGLSVGGGPAAGQPQHVYRTPPGPTACRSNGPPRTYDRPHTVLQTNRVIDTRKPDPPGYGDAHGTDYDDVKVRSGYGQPAAADQSPLYVKKRLPAPSPQARAPRPQDCFKTPLPLPVEGRQETQAAAAAAPFSRSKSDDHLVDGDGPTNVRYSSDRYLGRKMTKRDDFKSQPSSLDDVDKLDDRRAASGPTSGASSDGRLGGGGGGGQSDSGRGSTVYSSGKAQNSTTSPESSSEMQTNLQGTCFRFRDVATRYFTVVVVGRRLYPLCCYNQG